MKICMKFFGPEFYLLEPNVCIKLRLLVKITIINGNIYMHSNRWTRNGCAGPDWPYQIGHISLCECHTYSWFSLFLSNYGSFLISFKSLYFFHFIALIQTYIGSFILCGMALKIYISLSFGYVDFFCWMDVLPYWNCFIVLRLLTIAAISNLSYCTMWWIPTKLINQIKPSPSKQKMNFFFM